MVEAMAGKVMTGEPVAGDMTDTAVQTAHAAMEPHGTAMHAATAMAAERPGVDWQTGNSAEGDARRKCDNHPAQHDTPPLSRRDTLVIAGAPSFLRQREIPKRFIRTPQMTYDLFSDEDVTRLFASMI